MANLLDVYEDMLKEAEAQQIVNERVEFLSKYASAAAELLQAEYPNDFTKQDVAELADRLIDNDVQAAEMQEKTAEWEQAGRDLATEYAEELFKEAGLPADIDRIARAARKLVGKANAKDKFIEVYNLGRKHGKEGIDAAGKVVNDVIGQVGEVAGKGKAKWNELSTTKKVLVGTGAATLAAAPVAGGMYYHNKK